MFRVGHFLILIIEWCVCIIKWQETYISTIYKSLNFPFISWYAKFPFIFEHKFAWLYWANPNA